ncbi:regulatory protein, partial [Tilletia horrida]
MSGKQAASAATAPGRHSKAHAGKRPSSSKGVAAVASSSTPIDAPSSDPPAADPFSTMLAAAERKATHFRSLRAQIRHTHSHTQQQQQQSADDGHSRLPGGSSSSASGSSSSTSSSLPRIRTESSWSRFFGEIPDVAELEAAPITLLAARSVPPDHRAAATAPDSSSPPPTSTAKGKAPMRPLASLLASTASAQSAMVSSMPPEEKAQHFGPNYLPEEDSLRNDFAQRYVDSGAGELPGNAVRNPFVESRFDEYPKLKRLVHIKEELVSARAHAPTYLYADLRASLVPASQHHHYQRRQQRSEPVVIKTAPPASLAAAEAIEQTCKSGTGRSTAVPSADGNQTTSGITSPSAVTATTSVTTPASDSSVSTAQSPHSIPPPPSSTTLPIPQPFHLSQLMPIKYDVVIIDPPLEIYDWEGVPSLKSGRSGLDEVSPSLQQQQSDAPPDPKQSWTWDDIAKLPIPQLTAKESFIFLWVGSGAGDGLERGRELISKWGYRRCEDIVWVRTNRGAAEARLSGEGGAERGELQQSSTSSVLQRSVQHCLMGIRGTIKRSTDSRFVHCNVDTDVLIWEGDEQEHDSAASASPSGLEFAPPPRARDRVRAKPQEMYSLIENFCLGTRRLELFGTNRNLRRGWLTIGLEVGPHAPGFPESLPTTYLSTREARPIEEENVQQTTDASVSKSGEARDTTTGTVPTVKPVAYVKQQYDSHFGVDRPGCDLRERKNLLPFSPDSEALRPKSPPPRNAHSRGDSGNPLTPPPANHMALYGHNHNHVVSPGQHGGAGTGSSQWTSPNAGMGGASYGAQGHKSAGVLSPGTSAAMGSPRSSPRASMHGRGSNMHHHHHHHHNHGGGGGGGSGPMSPSSFIGGANLPPMSGYGAGGSPSSAGAHGGLGPGSPTRLLRHDALQQQQQPHAQQQGAAGFHPGGAGLSGLGAGGPKT